MSICPNCGHAVNISARYCETCGSALMPSEQIAGATPAIDVSIAASGVNVMLLSTGGLSPDEAADAIADICGYPAEEARLIAQSAPITIARGLPQPYAAQTALRLSGRGLCVTAYDSRGYVNEALHECISKGAEGDAGALAAQYRIEKHLMRPWNIPYRFEGDTPPLFGA